MKSNSAAGEDGRKERSIRSWVLGATSKNGHNQRERQPRDQTDEFCQAGQLGVKQLSVRPLSEIEEGVFERMMEPFDPAAQGEDRKEKEQPVGNEGDKEEEATQPKVSVAPTQPSREEVERHMATHLPYRSWCPHCVRGKSGSKPHRVNQRMHEIPTVALDYMFMHSNQGEQEERGMPIMVTKDLLNCGKGTGMISASVLIQKGVCGQAIRKLSSEIGKLGHPEIVLKSDGEPAIVALKQRVKQERSERIVLEESPVKDSQANGGIENAIRQTQGQIRAIKDCLESRLGRKITGDEVIFPWLVSHAAATINLSLIHISEPTRPY